MEEREQKKRDKSCNVTKEKSRCMNGKVDIPHDNAAIQITENYSLSRNAMEQMHYQLWPCTQQTHQNSLEAKKYRETDVFKQHLTPCAGG